VKIFNSKFLSSFRLSLGKFIKQTIGVMKDSEIIAQLE
jgi:hypothetical protein